MTVRGKGDEPPPNDESRLQARAQLRVVDVENPDVPVAPVPDGELSQRILQPLFRYVKLTFGEAALDRLAADAGLSRELMERTDAWISHERFERVLALARQLLPNDQEFMRACAHEILGMYGPVLLVLRCMSVRGAYEMMSKTTHLASKISSYEACEGTRTSIRLRYRSTRRESRLMCLSRQGQLRTVPTMYWGMAPARVTETTCIGRGDACCEYDLRWYEPVRWRGPLLGGIVGAIAATLLWGHIQSGFALLGLPILGLLAALMLEQRRVVDDHLQFSEQTNRELERLIQAHARAVDEVRALHQRERVWSQQLEHQIANRTARLDAVVERFRENSAPHRDKLRSLSHDINNPLTVLLGLANQLRREGHVESDAEEMVATLEGAVTQVSQLLRELATIVRDEQDTKELELETIDVPELATRIRRQLRATAVDRDIRVTVFQSREAPPAVSTVRMMLERIVDNLLTNAVKYTERGSIVCEVGGTPGFLLLKVSDTGRGIGPERLEQVLRAGGPDPNPPVGGSRGAGLSIVARLLDQLGGRLEIMSAPGEGTTVWMYLPCETLLHDRDGDAPEARPDAIESVLRRVVKIRPKPREFPDDDGEH
ncbi:MAG: HAMP domain-containing histidine kinase [Deltaproteobacteria bacterium]|nr:HAMP domain-containing histidine kinase [Nannocystaceae bacterium]